jgi:hypothetical protein
MEEEKKEDVEVSAEETPTPQENPVEETPA